MVHVVVYHNDVLHKGIGPELGEEVSGVQEAANDVAERLVRAFDYAVLTGGVSASGLKDVAVFVDNHGAKNFVAVEGTVLVTANGMDSGVMAAKGMEKGIQELCGGRLGFGRKDPAVGSRGVKDEQVVDIALATGNDFASRVSAGVDHGAEIGRATDKTEIHVEDLAGFQRTGSRG
jgi:hypothetical protein